VRRPLDEDRTPRTLRGGVTLDALGAMVLPVLASLIWEPWWVLHEDVRDPAPHPIATK